METRGIRWQCPICNQTYTEAELNNRFRCPRCDVEQLTLLLTEPYSYDRHSVTQRGGAGDEPAPFFCASIKHGLIV